MAIVYLHIGLPKTGTTAIQHLLWDNKDVLEKNGICYPDIGLRFPHISCMRNAYFLTKSYVEENGQHTKRRFCNEYESILDRLAEYGKKFGRIFLTEETLWRFWANRPDFWKQFRDDLREKGMDLYLIMYLRRQDDFMLSMYRQRIKSTSTGDSFYGHFNTLSRRYPLDYPAYIDMLSECVGRRKLIIRVYENGQYRGEEHNLLSDFLDIFGLALSDGFNVKQELYNPTLDGPCFELQRILNSLPSSPRNTPALNESMLFLQQKSACGDPPPKTTFFKPGEQTAYLAGFAESNKKLAEDYLGRKDGILFYDDSGTDLPEYEVDTNALLSETILFYGRTVQALEEEIKKLRGEIKKFRGEFVEVRENVFFYRLKRKILHLLGKDKSK